MQYVNISFGKCVLFKTLFEGNMKNSFDNNILELFCQTDIFKGCNKETLSLELSKTSKTVSFKKGETVFSKDCFSPSISVIVKGSARVKKGETTISHLKEGDLYGAAFLYNDISAFQNTVTALTPLTVVILNKDSVDEIIKKDPLVALNFIKYLSHRVSFLNEKIEGYTAQSAEDKLMHYLKKHADTIGAECEITVSMKELSSVLGISRASLYRVLDSLEKDQKIRRENKKIFILK